MHHAEAQRALGAQRGRRANGWLIASPRGRREGGRKTFVFPAFSAPSAPLREFLFPALSASPAPLRELPLFPAFSASSAPLREPFPLRSLRSLPLCVNSPTSLRSLRPLPLCVNSPLLSPLRELLSPLHLAHHAPPSLRLVRRAALWHRSAAQRLFALQTEQVRLPALGPCANTRAQLRCAWCSARAAASAGYGPPPRLRHPR